MHSRRVSIIAAAILAGAIPLGAQTGITDPVLRRIWALGMDSSHTWDLAQVLFDSIGPRLTGTPNGTNASDW
ncbi:MAG TPA: peptidase M28, partial [Gemmatimonadaceae bacterium]|nr:peptidase M28 [Gemmatimonadaceae bacterium]